MYRSQWGSKVAAVCAVHKSCILFYKSCENLYLSVHSIMSSYCYVQQLYNHACHVTCMTTLSLVQRKQHGYVFAKLCFQVKSYEDAFRWADWRVEQQGSVDFAHLTYKLLHPYLSIKTLWPESKLKNFNWVCRCYRKFDHSEILLRHSYFLENFITKRNFFLGNTV